MASHLCNVIVSQALTYFCSGNCVYIRLQSRSSLSAFQGILLQQKKLSIVLSVIHSYSELWYKAKLQILSERMEQLELMATAMPSIRGINFNPVYSSSGIYT